MPRSRGPDDFFTEPARRPERERPDRSPVPPSVEVADAILDLPGTILMVPDKFWGFRSPSSQDHPGACVSTRLESRVAILLKGTDRRSARPPYRHYVVLPSPGNGLTKACAFQLSPRRLRLGRVLLMIPERRMGTLDPDDLRGIRSELERIFPFPR